MPHRCSTDANPDESRAPVTPRQQADLSPQSHNYIGHNYIGASVTPRQQTDLPPRSHTYIGYNYTGHHYIGAPVTPRQQSNFPPRSIRCACHVTVQAVVDRIPVWQPVDSAAVWFLFSESSAPLVDQQSVLDHGWGRPAEFSQELNILPDALLFFRWQIHVRRLTFDNNR